MKTNIHLTTLLCLITLATQTASAQLINLNFSSTPYAGNTETSPATPGGAAGVWNNLTIGTANAADSYETDGRAVLFSDGSAGPTLTLDASSGSGSTWTGTSLSFSTVNYTTSGGVYDVASLYESGLINGGNNTTGFRIKGLTPGTYAVSMVPFFRGSQAAGVKADPAVTFSIGLGNNTDARNTGDFTLTSTAASPTQNIDTRLTSWVTSTDGTTPYNYIGATVTIDSTDRWLTFFLRDSATTGPDRPGPGVIQLQAVPEPSTIALFGCGLGLAAFALRRRKR